MRKENETHSFALDKSLLKQHNLCCRIDVVIKRESGDRMPPKAKFSRQHIVDAALLIVRKNGIESLTARALAEKLGSSAQPIFTVFKNMEEVQDEVKRATKELFTEWVSEAKEYTPAFKQVGVLMIRFAIEEPKLFQLLFMWERENVASFSDYMKHLGELTDTSFEQLCIELIRKEHDINEEKAKELFQQVWIFTFGVSVLCATKSCSFTDAEIEELLGREFISMLMYIKAGKLNEKTPHPRKKDLTK